MPYPNTNNNKDLFPWTGQVKIDGKKKRRQFKTKKEARFWEEEQRQIALDPYGQQTSMMTSVSLGEWATRYLQYAKKEFVSNTFVEKRTTFKLFFAYERINKDMPVDLLEPLMILDHLQVQEEVRSGNAANKDRKNLSAAWEWGRKFLNMPLVNPIRVVDKFAEDRHERSVPTLEEFCAVLDKCETDQDRLMLWAYLQTGARREELFRLTWKDVNFKKNEIRLCWRKNKKGQWREAWLPVKEELMAQIRSQQRVTGFMCCVFMNFQGSDDPKHWVPYLYRQHWLKGLCRNAAVKQFGFHGIRHLFASILAAQNVPLVEIQFMLRHSSISTTQRYIHRLKQQNREVLESLPDLSDIRKGPSATLLVSNLSDAIYAK